MADDQNRLPNSDEDSTPPTPARKPLREVRVTHLDEPPSLGKKEIHPRRPAPIVRTREERTSQDQGKDKETD